MIVLVIIIYIVLSVCLGPAWPVEMFLGGGCLGQIIVAVWVALLLTAIGYY